MIGDTEDVWVRLSIKIKFVRKFAMITRLHKSNIQFTERRFYLTSCFFGLSLSPCNRAHIVFGSRFVWSESVFVKTICQVEI